VARGGWAVWFALLSAILVTGPALAAAARAPSLRESQGMHAALVDHLACCTAARAPAPLRLRRMVISRLDPRLGAEEVSGLLTGPRVAVLARAGRGRWRVIAFGDSVYVGCRVVPLGVLQDLLGPRWCGET